MLIARSLFSCFVLITVTDLGFSAPMAPEPLVINVRIDWERDSETTAEQLANKLRPGLQQDARLYADLGLPLHANPTNTLVEVPRYLLAANPFPTFSWR